MKNSLDRVVTAKDWIGVLKKQIKWNNLKCSPERERDQKQERTKAKE